MVGGPISFLLGLSALTASAFVENGADKKRKAYLENTKNKKFDHKLQSRYDAMCRMETDPAGFDLARISDDFEAFHSNHSTLSNLFARAVVVSILLKYRGYDYDFYSIIGGQEFYKFIPEFMDTKYCNDPELFEFACNSDDYYEYMEKKRPRDEERLKAKVASDFAAAMERAEAEEKAAEEEANRVLSKEEFAASMQRDIDYATKKSEKKRKELEAKKARENANDIKNAETLKKSYLLVSDTVEVTGFGKYYNEDVIYLDITLDNINIDNLIYDLYEDTFYYYNPHDEIGMSTSEDILAAIYDNSIVFDNIETYNNELEGIQDVGITIDYKNLIIFINKKRLFTQLIDNNYSHVNNRRKADKPERDWYKDRRSQYWSGTVINENYWVDLLSKYELKSLIPEHKLFNNEFERVVTWVAGYNWTPDRVVYSYWIKDDWKQPTKSVYLIDHINSLSELTDESKFMLINCDDRKVEFTYKELYQAYLNTEWPLDIDGNKYRFCDYCNYILQTCIFGFISIPITY